MELKEALEAVVYEAEGGFADYAKSYAKAALELGECNHHFFVTDDNSPRVVISHVPTRKMMVGKELKVQLLYVLSNLQHFRGERAKEIKKVLKDAIK